MPDRVCGISMLKIVDRVMGLTGGTAATMAITSIGAIEFCVDFYWSCLR